MIHLFSTFYKELNFVNVAWFAFPFPGPAPVEDKILQEISGEQLIQQGKEGGTGSIKVNGHSSSNVDGVSSFAQSDASEALPGLVEETPSK